jgi:hypothetical protein
VILPATIPFALAAASFPAGIATVMWLLSAPPALPRGVAYLSGAGVTTVISGVLILALMRSVGGSDEHPGVTAGFEIGVGVVLLVLVLILAIRKPTLDARPRGGSSTRRGHAGIFLLGAAMWTPSFAYVAALQMIADAELSATGVALNLLIVDIVVLSLIEVPLVAYALAPDRAARVLGTVRTRVARLGWRLGASVAAIGGVYLILRGWQRLT